MDNFFCSHRCTSYVRLWLGARRCSNTNASRYLVLLTSLFGFSIPLLSPVCDLREKLSNSINVLLTPEANLNPAYPLNLRGGHFLCRNIAMQRNCMNSEVLC